MLNIDTKGFTLCELLVALGIFCIGAVALGQGLKAVYVEHRRSQFRAALLYEARHAMECMREGFYDNIENAKLHGVRYASGLSILEEDDELPEVVIVETRPHV